MRSAEGLDARAYSSALPWPTRVPVIAMCCWLQLRMRGAGEAELSRLHGIKLFGVRAERQRADRQASASQLRRARRCLRLDAPGAAAAAAGAERSGGAEGLLAARAAADEELSLIHI